jgi:hypothetical protein
MSSRCQDGDVPKRCRIASEEEAAEKLTNAGGDFEQLPDEVVVSILAGVAASATIPADLASATMT